jgi:hypothetical protein
VTLAVNGADVAHGLFHQTAGQPLPMVGDTIDTRYLSAGTYFGSEWPDIVRVLRRQFAYHNGARLRPDDPAIGYHYDMVEVRLTVERFDET